MPDIDLEPKDYKATPIKGERFFAHHGATKLLAILAWLALGLLISAILQHPSQELSDWLWSLWH